MEKKTRNIKRELKSMLKKSNGYSLDWKIQYLKLRTHWMHLTADLTEKTRLLDSKIRTIENTQIQA